MVIWIPWRLGADHLENDMYDFVFGVIVHDAVMFSFGMKPLGIRLNDRIVVYGHFDDLGKHGLNFVLREVAHARFAVHRRAGFLAEWCHAAIACELARVIEPCEVAGVNQ